MRVLRVYCPHVSTCWSSLCCLYSCLLGPCTAAWWRFPKDGWFISHGFGLRLVPEWAGEDETCREMSDRTRDSLCSLCLRLSRFCTRLTWLIKWCSPEEMEGTTFPCLLSNRLGVYHEYPYESKWCSPGKMCRYWQQTGFTCLHIPSDLEYTFVLALF